MSLPRDGVWVVTGGASGIGAALARAAAARGATVVVVDRDGDGAADVAAGLPGARALPFDVTDQVAVESAVDRIERKTGPIATWFGNAGVAGADGLGAPTDWTMPWAVHVGAHVSALGALVPRMIARGGGTIVFTASAAGLLTSIESASYAVTKHATVALAEWAAIAYADRGIRVHCLCPQAVDTPMIAGHEELVITAGDLLGPAEVADHVLSTVDRGEFLVLPHPEVREHEQRRAANRDRWLAGMARLRVRSGVGRSA